MKILINLLILTISLNAEAEIRSIGSDILNNTLVNWSEEYFKLTGNKIIIEGKGSNTAIPALLNGESDIGPISRQIKAVELQNLKKMYDSKPLLINVAVEMAVVHVHNENILHKRGVSLEELDAIYSSSLKRGAPSNINKWTKLSKSFSTGTDIIPYISSSATRVHGLLLTKALLKGKFRKNIIQTRYLPKDEIHSIFVGSNKPGFKEVKIVPLLIDGVKVMPTADNCLTGKYPLARTISIITAPKPSKEIKKFLKYILSESGQNLLLKDDLLPLSEIALKSELLKISNY